MPRVRYNQEGFVSGEISRSLQGRVSMDVYRNALLTCKNMIPTPEGRVVRRPGTKYVAESTEGAVLIPYEFDTERSFVLELCPSTQPATSGSTDGTIRVIQGGELGAVYRYSTEDGSGIPVGIPANSPIVTTLGYQPEDMKDLNWFYHLDQVIITHPLYPPAVFKFIDKGTYGNSGFYWGIYTFDYGPYLPVEDVEVGALRLFYATGQGRRITLKSSSAFEFIGISVGEYVEFRYQGDIVLGRVTTAGTDTVVVEPVPYITDSVAPEAVLERVQTTNFGGTPNNVGVNQDRAHGLIRPPSGETRIEVWSDVQTLSFSVEGSWLRILDSTNADKVTWLRLKRYLGVAAKPETYITGTAITGTADYLVGRIYQLTYKDPSSSLNEDQGHSAQFDSAAIFTGTADVGDAVADMSTTKNYERFLVFEGTPVPTTTSDAVLVQEGGSLKKTVDDYVGVTQITEDTHTARLAWLGDSNLFSAFDEAPGPGFFGRFVRIKLGDDWVDLQVTNWVNTVAVDVEVLSSIPRSPKDPQVFYDGGQTKTYALGAFYLGDSSLHRNSSFPTMGASFQNRIYFGGTLEYPNQIWASSAFAHGDFRFSAPNGEVLDDSGFGYELSGETANRFRWAVSDQFLIIGTDGYEGQIMASSFGEAITPTNVRLALGSSYGSSFPATKLNTSLLFIQRGETRVRELLPASQSGQLSSTNLNIFNHDILDARIVHYAYQRNPIEVAWFVLSNGQVVSLTLDQERRVVAWAHHELGGNGAPFAERGEALNVVTYTNPNSHQDSILFHVRRRVDGSDVYTLEEITNVYRPYGGEALKYVDCHVIAVFDSSYNLAANGFGGLFTGETLSGARRTTQDKYYQERTYTVSGSDVVQDNSGDGNFSKYIGYGYPSELELPLVSLGEAMRGTHWRIISIAPFFERYFRFKYGVGYEDLTEEDGFSGSLSSGLEKIIPDLDVVDDWEQNKSLWLTHSGIYPLSILSLEYELEVNE